MLNTNEINFEKMGGLIPVCIQDHQTMQVLMLGFMNQEALSITLATGKVTFYSRSKQRLWTKGETSGNELSVINIHLDCDQDTLLIMVKPTGPTCHTGDQSCFKTSTVLPFSGLSTMIETIEDRARYPKQNSYTCSLFEAGIPRIAQKIGEEGVEVVLAAVTSDDNELLNESADLLFHLCVLLRVRNLSMNDVCAVLDARNQKSR